MSACEAPQYSAHAPRNAPVRVGSSASRVMRPGIMSILPASDGTQNEWITSGLASCSSTRWPTGRRSSLAVSISPVRRHDTGHATTTASP